MHQGARRLGSVLVVSIGVLIPSSLIAGVTDSPVDGGIADRANRADTSATKASVDGIEASRSAAVGCRSTLPTFTFRWTGTRTVELTAAAKPAGDFVIELRPVDPIRLTAGWASPVTRPQGVPYRIYADEGEGGPGVPVNLHDYDLFENAGLVHIDFADPLAPCPDRRDGGVDVTIYRMNDLRIEAGVAFFLNPEGDFSAFPEFAVRAWTQGSAFWRSGAEFRYTVLGTGHQAVDAGTAISLQSGAGTLEGNVFSLINPFAFCSSKGELPPRLELLGALGIRTRKGGKPDADGGIVAGTEFTDVQPRVALGMLFSVPGYSGSPTDTWGGSSASVAYGAAWDRYWKLSETGSNKVWRFWLEGSLDIPKIGGKYVRFSVRIFANTSVDFQGPSELKLIALTALDPTVFATIFSGK